MIVRMVGAVVLHDEIVIVVVVAAAAASEMKDGWKKEDVDHYHPLLLHHCYFGKPYY